MSGELIGQKLRGLREGKKLTLRQLSERSGYSLIYLNKVEMGHRIPSHRFVDAMAAVFDVPASYFFTEEPERDAAGGATIRVDEDGRALKCPKCGATEFGYVQGSGPAKWCIFCGMPLFNFCTSCHAVNPPTALFCGECGADTEWAKSGFLGGDRKNRSS